MTEALTQVEQYADQMADARRERDRWIAVASAEGASLRQIAAVAGISHEAVAKIVRDHKETESDGETVGHR